jgi:DNA-binding response OmpR family regulator
MSLENYGFAVDTFNESKKESSRFKPNHYELVILGIKMPEIDALNYTRK